MKVKNKMRIFAKTTRPWKQEQSTHLKSKIYFIIA